ncbi:MAG: hypothetical protein ACRDZR_03485 [Acidimicrobiales bacterium]
MTSARVPNAPYRQRRQHRQHRRHRCGAPRRATALLALAILVPAVTAVPLLGGAAAVAGAAAPPPVSAGTGYVLAAADGAALAFGTAHVVDSISRPTMNAPVVAVAGAPDGEGYWQAGSDGGVFASGDAAFYGSMGGRPLNSPVVGMAATPDGEGYWLVAGDGGMFAFGDAAFYGSMGGRPLNSPVVGMVPTLGGRGYWLAAADGGVFAFGDARFYGSMAGSVLGAPVVAVAATSDGGGYWLAAADGGMFSFGNAAFYGSATGRFGTSPVVAAATMASAPGLSFPGQPGPAAGPASIVQLGDSVASGEGTLYGYTYNSTTQTWTGGTVTATWPGPYPLCHDSPYAYGQVLATHYGAKLSQFGCTGASFTNGITTTRVNAGYFSTTVLRPAEFGNWATKADLNATYDAAKPDLVLATMGADDVQFVHIVEGCIENGYEYYWDAATLECVTGNPGPTVTTDFLDYLPTFRTHLKTLAQWITARGTADGKVPKVVFTDYYNPLPTGTTTCPDSNYLYPAQIRYLSSLLQELDTTIVQTIDGLGDPNVAVADLSGALDGHEWCTSDPWAYGLSIYQVTSPSSFDSQAPFHPTPRGQEQLASLVQPVVDRLFAGS